MTSTKKAHLALLGTNLFFAANYTSIKFIVNGGYVEAFGLNLLRVGVCSILLWILFLFKKQKQKIKREDYGRLFLCALTGIAINQLMFIKGLSYTTSIHASLLMLTTPILISILAAFVLKEALTRMKIFGLFLGLSGAILLILGRTSYANAPNIILGDVLIIINAISYTFYIILVKPMMTKYEPIMIIRMIFTIGFFLILPFCFTEFVAVDWPALPGIAYGNLVLIVLFGTFLAYIMNLYGIKILGASVAGAYIYSQPILAASIAMIFLGETLTWPKVMAGALIAIGVYLSNSKSRK